MRPAATPDELEAARAYESLFVPAIFAQCAELVADAARIGPGERVLDVACGTGVLAREAARRVGPAGFVAGVDPAPGMLAVAAERAPALEWHLGAAEALPLPDAFFDVAVCQFGLMFCADPRRAVRELLRVVAAGGRLAVAVWAALEDIPAYAAEVRVLARVAGTAAADALRAPFALGDRAELVALLDAAGADALEATTLRPTARFAGVRPLVESDLRGWLPLMGVTLDEPTIERCLAAAEDELAGFVAPDGSLVFDCPAHLVTARRADERPPAG